jgi:hypothetical protein
LRTRGICASHHWFQNCHGERHSGDARSARSIKRRLLLTLLLRRISRRLRATHIPLRNKMNQSLSRRTRFVSARHRYHNSILPHVHTTKQMPQPSKSDLNKLSTTASRRAHTSPRRVPKAHVLVRHHLAGETASSHGCWQWLERIRKVSECWNELATWALGEATLQYKDSRQNARFRQRVRLPEVVGYWFSVEIVRMTYLQRGKHRNLAGSIIGGEWCPMTSLRQLTTGLHGVME